MSHSVALGREAFAHFDGRGANNLCIGEYAGRDLPPDVEGARIIGDGIVDLDPAHNHDVLFIGEKVAIGKTVFGRSCNLQEIVLEALSPGALMA